MFWRSYASKLLKKVDPNLEHKSISVELATPRSIATFYLGYLLYVRFIDQEVRKQIASQSKSLAPYIDQFLKAQDEGVFIQSLFPIFGLISSGLAYFQSKNIFWLIGGASCLGILGYEHFIVGPLRLQLINQEKDSPYLSEKRQMQNTQKRFGLIRKLTQYLNGKLCITVFAMIAFYIAELKHSSQIDVKLNLKK